jgi:type I restriction enzyme, S subunit
LEKNNELPDGWVETNLETCVEILDSKRIPINSRERQQRLGNIPYYGATGQVGTIDDYLFDEELVLLGEDGAPFFDSFKNKAYLINDKSWVNNHAHVLKGISDLLLNKFLCYYLNQIDYREYVNGTTRLKLNQTSMKKISIRLSPINEQKRIVEKIEYVFSELDDVKKMLDHIQKQLKQYKQSLLKSIFEKPQKKDVTNTSGSTLGDYIKIQNGYAFKSDWFKNNGIRLLRNINVGHRVINWENSVFLDKSQAGQFTRFQLFENDIVISMDRPIIKSGLKLARLKKNDLPALLLQRVGKFMILNNELENGYFYLWLQSKAFLNSLNPGRSLGVPHVSATELENIPFKIKIPSIIEQKEIVSDTERRFSLIKNTENITTLMLLQLNTLRSTVLKHAFEGKLVPQDPNDESASELLKRIKLEN